MTTTNLTEYRDEALRLAREAEARGETDWARQLRAKAAKVTAHLDRTQARRRARR